MQFADLYAFANTLPGPVIATHVLAARVTAFHDEVGAVNFWPVDLDPAISLGHIIYETERDSAYGEEYRVANIRYHKGMNRCWRRFVCCKELMHVFDDEEQRAGTREKFLELLNQLETTPSPGARSPMYESEIRAMWMALMILCPDAVRAKYKLELDAKDITEYDVAMGLLIPEAMIKDLMSPSFDLAKEVLLR